MKKNYNFNYVNRTTADKSAIEFSNVESASCTAKVLKDSKICNGRLWHTTDTNEFYYDWNGNRMKLNVTGDSESVMSEINKIKADVAKLDPENMTKLENKVNQAVSKVNGIESNVNTAIENANAATQAATNAASQAQEAASQVENKVDRSELDNYAKVTDIPDVSNFASKSEIPDVSDFASKSDIPDVSDFASKSDIPDVSNFASKSDIPSVEGLASESWVENKGYITEHQDISGKADKSELPSKVSDLPNDAGYLTVNDLPDYLTESELPDVETGVFPSGNNMENIENPEENGLATVQDVMSYVREFFEKKKDELDGGSEAFEIRDYVYISGYGLNDSPTDITVMNRFVLNEDEDTEIVVLTPAEIPTWDTNTNDDLPSIKARIDIPSGYSLKAVYLWNEHEEVYEYLNDDPDRSWGVNPRYTTRIIDGVTYYSYVRGPIDDVAANNNIEQYKFIIGKQ